jgi:hypothetical protein
MEYPNADRFVKQLLMHRYKCLIDQLAVKFNLTQDQIDSLQKRILNVEWIHIEKDD